MKYRIKEVRLEGVPGAAPIYYIQRRVWFWWVDHTKLNAPSPYVGSDFQSRSPVSFKNLSEAKAYTQNAEAESTMLGKVFAPKIRRKVTIHAP